MKHRILKGGTSGVVYLIGFVWVVSSLINFAYAGQVLDSLSPGEWGVVNKKLVDVRPPDPPTDIPSSDRIKYPYRADVIEPWSGGAFDSKRNRLIVWGGGHKNYAGNEIYVFDVPTEQWIRLTDPSILTSNDIQESAANEATGVYDDGLPRSRHSYNFVEYVPIIDSFCSFGAGGTFPSSSAGDKKIHCFDFTMSKNTSVPRKNWDSTRATLPYKTGGSQEIRISSMAAYDAITQSVWYHSTAGGMLSQYNVPKDSWSTKTTTTMNYYSTPAIAADDKYHMMVAVGDGKIWYWDLDNPNSPPTHPATSGDNGIENAKAPGFQYDLKLQKFVAWYGGSSVYILDPTNWKWTKQLAASSNNVTPTAPAQYGTYGRFRYMPSLNAYIVVNHISESVYMLKLSDGAGVPGGSTAPPPLVIPKISLSANPNNINAGDTTTISWTISDSTSCSAPSGWATPTELGNGTSSKFVGPLSSDTTFAIDCVGPDGNKSNSVRVTVAPVGLPVVTLSAADTTLNHNQSTTITWSSDADVCAKTGDWPTAVLMDNAPNGSIGTGNLEGGKTYSYNLECANTQVSPNLTTKASVDVVVAAPQAVGVNIWSTPSSINLGESATINWEASDAVSCDGKPWTDATGTTGSVSVSPKQSTTYTLSCAGVASQASAQVRVNVLTDGEVGNLLDLETFDSYALGGDPVNWVDTANGNSMNQDDTIFKILSDGGNKVFGTTRTSGSNIHSHYIDNVSSQAWSNYRYTGQMKLSSLQDAIGVTFYSDYDNSDTYYRIRRENNNPGTFKLSKHPDNGGSVCTSGTIDSGVKPVAGVWYNFMIEAESLSSQTEIRAKIWADGSTEPNWQIICSDSSAGRIQQGTVGLWAVVQDAGPKYWDDLAVAPIGAGTGSSEPQPETSELTLNVDQSSLDDGTSTTLSWSGRNVSSCSANGYWAQNNSVDANDPSGSQSTGTLTEGSYVYAIACTGTDNSALSAEVKVTVGGSNSTNPTTPPIGSGGAGSGDGANEESAGNMGIWLLLLALFTVITRRCVTFHRA